MRFRFAAMLGVSLLALFLMGASGFPLAGAGESQVLLSERVGEPATEAARPHVRLHIVNGFTAEEEASLIAAVVDWNRTRPVRLDVAALNFDAVEPGAWSISSANGGNNSPRITAHALSTDSGSIVVNVDRVADGDVRRVVAQEFAKLFDSTLLAHSPTATVIAR